MRQTRTMGAIAVIASWALLTAGMSATATAAPVSTEPGEHPATDVVQGYEKHSFYPHEFGFDQPGGVTYVEGPGVLAVAESRTESTVVAMLRTDRDEVVGRMSIPRLDAPATLADDGRGTLAALDGQALLSWPAAARGEATVRRSRVEGVSVDEASAMTYDPMTRSWLVLDPIRQRIVAVDDKGKVPRATERVSLDGLDAGSLQGIAVEPLSGQVYVADSEHSRVYGLSSTGEVLEVVDVADTGTFTSMAFGATADPTDATAETGLYVTQSAETSEYGLVSELSLEPLGALAVQASSESTGTLVRKTLLSQLTPPSPDPSGITYMRDRQRLLIVDSEVDEMNIYDGVNLWLTPRDGSFAADTGNTLKFSKEPTGVGYDADAQRMFVSDDDRGSVFQVTTGSDNRFGTTDDSVTSFSTTAFGNDDLEDVTFDSTSGDLFLTEGVGAEVWRVSSGANGRFDGIAPAGDDQVSHFDVGAFGITDLEGIGYSISRDSLFLADRKFPRILEVTKDGGLVQSIDVEDLDMDKPAAITTAPATDDPTRTSLYVTTRGVDNDNHPDENDGTLYEVRAPDLGPVGPQTNSAPVVSAGADSTVTLPASAILAGSVDDDGLPHPPGFTTKSWTKMSGPGSVAFADPASASTTATFTAAGTYVLRLVATDSLLSVADDVTVVVRPPTGTNTPPTVTAGADQTVALPASAGLNGVVTDDGLPSPPGATTVAWTKVSGTGSVSFADPTAPSTLASFGIAGTYVLRLTVSDSELSAFDEVTVVALPPPPVGNLVKNSGFEVDTSGWRTPATATGTTLTRVAVPRSGSWAAQADNTNATSTRCTLTDSPNWITTTEPVAYSVSAWVRAANAGDTGQVRLLAREYATVGGTNLGTTGATVTLTSDWQKLEVTHVPAQPGASTLDISVERSQTPAATTCFLIDDIVAMPPQPNTAPLAAAGDDVTLTMPTSSTELRGSVSDDGLPESPGQVTTSWSVVSGPGAVIFGDASRPATTASFSDPGIYVLRLTASDGSLETFDEVQVTVSAAPVVNKAPVVVTGADASVTLPGSATLDATVNDDGLPNPPAKVITTWSKAQGPGTVAFGDASAVDTTASFSAAGTYVLQLTASDSELSTSDEVTVTVSSEAPPVNKAPTVDAGANQPVTMPSVAILDGTVADDGLPNPPAAVTATWSKRSGPGPVTFGDGGTKVGTTATFSREGIYVLQLTASDSELTVSDEVTVTVSSEPTTGGGGTGGGPRGGGPRGGGGSTLPSTEPTNPPAKPVDPPDQPTLSREVIASLSDETVMVGRVVRIRGTVSPADDDQVVRLQRRRAGTWRTVVTTRADSDGAGASYSFATTSGRSGSHRYRVRVAAYDGMPVVTTSTLRVQFYRAAVTALSAKREWVKITNTGRVHLDLAGWKLRNMRNGKVVTLEALVVRPGRTVRVHSGAGRDDGNNVYLGGKPMWGKRGKAILRDDTRRLASRFRY